MIADTVAAISTAPGRGAIAVVRVSGPESIEIADRLFKGKEPLSLSRTHSVRYGKLTDPSGRVLDEVLVCVMRAPETFTGEDIVEVSCHGGPVTSQLVLEAFLSCGCRMADPGEFTRRAFLNNRMDLAQAEAVAELVAAKTREAAGRALRQLEGELSEEISKVRASVVSVLSEVEAVIDFPEDVPDPPESATLVRTLEECRDTLAALVSERRVAAVLKAGARTPIIGRPNVGKSSLLNAIVGRSRAIVAAEPGTTRDSIEEEVEIGGFPITLVDTAGLRSATEEVEEEGVRRSMEQLRLGDLVVLVVEAGRSDYEADLQIMDVLGERPCVVAINKIDVASPHAARAVLGSRCEQNGSRIVEVSAKTGAGIPVLQEVLAERLGSGELELHEAGRVELRHLECLRSGLKNVTDASAALQAGVSAELVAFELREAAEALDSVTGKRVGPDILENIFSRFCVGK